MSITSLAIVSIDRYICISYPFRYNELFSKRRASIVLIMCWVYAGAIAAFSVTIPKFIKFQPQFYNCGIDVTAENTQVYTLVLLTFGFYIPLVIIFFCCLQITRIAWSARRKINRHKIGPLMTREEHRLKERAKQAQVAARVFVVIAVFLICWGPFAANMHYGLILGRQFPWQISVAFEFLAKFNSAVNPFIYMLTNVTFRKVFFSKYCSCFLKNGSKNKEKVPVHTISAAMLQIWQFQDINGKL